MDATLDDMGYRGGDDSRTRADRGRHASWQSSPGTGPTGTEPQAGGAHGDWPAGGHPVGDYGYPQDAGYAGYGEQGYSEQGYSEQGYSEQGYGPDGGYADGYAPPAGDGQFPGYGYPQPGHGHPPGGYGAPSPAGYDTAGYGEQGYGTAGYDTAGYDTAGYGSTGYGTAGYGTAGYGTAGYGGSGRGFPDGYQEPDDGYQGHGFGEAQTGGYPARHADSGGYPEQDAGNDWYGGQPAAASGASFADTGTYTLNGRVIDEYGSGPHGVLRDPARGYPPVPGAVPQPDRPQLPAAAAPPATGPQALPRTGQQERYDDYEPYAGYGPGDGAGREGAAGPADYGFPADDYDADGYDYPADGYDYPADGYADGDYADEGDPYQEHYTEDAGRRSRGRGRGRGRDKGKGKAARAEAGAPADSPPGEAKAGRTRGKRPLALTALAIGVVGIVGAAAYVFLLRHPAPPADANTSAPLPTSGALPSQQACTKQYGTYCHIENRTDDPAPLTLSELFPPAFANQKGQNTTTLVAEKLDKKCSDAVIGTDLTNTLAKGHCTQLLRASYLSSDGKIMGTIGVANLATTNEAHYAGRVVGQQDFVTPLPASKGAASKLGKGTGVVEAEFKGHYLILTWAEFTDGTAPSGTAQDKLLEHFSTALVAGTVNTSLSQRMVTGAPASPGASSG